MSCPEPEFRVGSFMTVTFRPNPEVRAEGGDRLAGGVAPEVTSEVAPEGTEQVTGEEVRLLRAMSGEMTRQRIQEALGLKHEDHFRHAYLLLTLSAPCLARRSDRNDHPGQAAQQQAAIPPDACGKRVPEADWGGTVNAEDRHRPGAVPRPSSVGSSRSSKGRRHRFAGGLLSTPPVLISQEGPRHPPLPRHRPTSCPR